MNNPACYAEVLLGEAVKEHVGLLDGTVPERPGGPAWWNRAVRWIEVQAIPREMHVHKTCALCQQPMDWEPPRDVTDLWFGRPTPVRRAIMHHGCAMDFWRDEYRDRLISDMDEARQIQQAEEVAAIIRQDRDLLDRLAET